MFYASNTASAITEARNLDLQWEINRQVLSLNAKAHLNKHQALMISICHPQPQLLRTPLTVAAPWPPGVLLPWIVQKSPTPSPDSLIAFPQCPGDDRDEWVTTSQFLLPPNPHPDPSVPITSDVFFPTVHIPILNLISWESAKTLNPRLFQSSLQAGWRRGERRWKWRHFYLDSVQTRRNRRLYLRRVYQY